MMTRDKNLPQSVTYQLIGDDPLTTDQIVQIKVSKKSLKLDPVREAMYRNNMYYHMRVQPLIDDDSQMPLLLRSHIYVAGEDTEFTRQDTLGTQITDKFVIFMFRVSDYRMMVSLLPELMITNICVPDSLMNSSSRIRTRTF